MNRIALGILLALAIALAGVTFMEACALRSDDATWRPTPRRPQATHEHPAPAAEHAKEWVATILQRPLFSQTRRPPPGEGTSGPGLPRLSGILVSPSERTAIFAATGGGKPIIAGEGARIGAYVLQSISAGQVTLVGPGGDRVLRPSFAPAATAPAGLLTPTSAAMGQPSLIGLVQSGPPVVQGAQ